MKHIQKNITPEARQALTTFIRKEKKKAHYDNFKQSDGKNALNLNVLFLQDVRKRVYESVKTLIDLKCRNKTTTQAQKIISDIIDDWTTKNAKGEYKEYCAVVPYFFKKYLV